MSTIVVGTGKVNFSFFLVCARELRIHGVHAAAQAQGKHYLRQLRVEATVAYADDYFMVEVEALSLL